MENSELLQAIGAMIDEKLKPVHEQLDRVQTDINGVKRGQSKMQAQIQGVKAEMHERFDKMESITEYALKEIDYLDQAYKAL